MVSRKKTDFYSSRDLKANPSNMDLILTLCLKEPESFPVSYVNLSLSPLLTLLLLLSAGMSLAKCLIVRCHIFTGTGKGRTFLQCLLALTHACPLLWSLWETMQCFLPSHLFMSENFCLLIAWFSLAFFFHASLGAKCYIHGLYDMRHDV